MQMTDMHEKNGQNIEKLAAAFEKSQKILTAIGDESRQHIILTMLSMDDCNGVRAIEVAKKSDLSRPAVSHHLQIMKDAGLLKTRKEGTRIYYYFDPDMTKIKALIDMLHLAVDIAQHLPDRTNIRKGDA